MKTLQSLDVNGNGKVDASEIAIFAKSQGIDAASATSELAGLDVDGDGALNAQELASVLGTGAEPAPQQPALRSQPAVAQAAVQPMMVAQAAVPSAPVAPAAAPAMQNVAHAPTVSMASAPLAASTAMADVGAVDVAAESGRMSAQSAAKVMEQQLALEAQEQAQAQSLEHRAAELRANSTALARQMLQSATAAGNKAATNKAQKVLSSLMHLEAEETKKEVAAAALRAKAKAELREAQELMSVADLALRQVAPHGTSGSNPGPAL